MSMKKKKDKINKGEKSGTSLNYIPLKFLEKKQQRSRSIFMDLKIYLKLKKSDKKYS